MDLAQLTADLEALRDARDRRRPPARPTRRRSTPWRSRSWARRASSRRSCAGSARCRPRTARRSAPSRTRSAASVEAALGRGSRRVSAAPSSPPGSPPRPTDVTTPGRPIRRGSLHPIVETAREIADVFAQFGFVVVRGPGDRGRRHQLPDAQHPARPPGARPVGHALPRRRRPAPAHAHEPRPDPRHAPGAAADPRAAAGPLLPVRGRRRQPRVRVLPGRGPDGRRGHVDGPPQGPARPVRPRDVRRRPRDAVPARLLPVHRAVRGVRHPVRHLQRGEVPRLLADGLDDDPRRGHGPPGRPALRRHRPRALPGLRVRHGRRADREPAPRRRRPARCTWRTTCASSGPSDEGARCPGCASSSTST